MSSWMLIFCVRQQNRVSPKPTAFSSKNTLFSSTDGDARLCRDTRWWSPVGTPRRRYGGSITRRDELLEERGALPAGIQLRARGCFWSCKPSETLQETPHGTDRDRGGGPNKPTRLSPLLFFIQFITDAFNNWSWSHYLLSCSHDLSCLSSDVKNFTLWRFSINADLKKMKVCLHECSLSLLIINI